jgi:hypothetical protein
MKPEELKKADYFLVEKYDDILPKIKKKAVFFALSSIKQSGPCSSVIFHLLDLKLF